MHICLTQFSNLIFLGENDWRGLMEPCNGVSSILRYVNRLACLCSLLELCNDIKKDYLLLELNMLLHRAGVRSNQIPTCTQEIVKVGRERLQVQYLCQNFVSLHLQTIGSAQLHVDSPAISNCIEHDLSSCAVLKRGEVELGSGTCRCDTWAQSWVRRLSIVVLDWHLAFSGGRSW